MRGPRGDPRTHRARRRQLLRRTRRSLAPRTERPGGLPLLRRRRPRGARRQSERLAAQHRGHHQLARQRARDDAPSGAVLRARAGRRRWAQAFPLLGRPRAEGAGLMSLDTVDQRRLREVALTPEEYRVIVEKLRRAPNAVELGMLGVLWSEHCSYKSSKALLRPLPSTAERGLYAPAHHPRRAPPSAGLAPPAEHQTP